MKTSEPEMSPERKEAFHGTADNHPVGTGVGALGGAAVGAAIGSSIGPLGAVTGAVLGGTFGAIAGKGIAEGIEPTVEQEFWEKQYRSEPYFDNRYLYEDYDPAYRLGALHYHPETSFEAAEKRMSDEWEQGKGSSKLDWRQAREAAKASWEHAGRSRAKP